MRYCLRIPDFKAARGCKIVGCESISASNPYPKTKIYGLPTSNHNNPGIWLRNKYMIFSCRPYATAALGTTIFLLHLLPSFSPIDSVALGKHCIPSTY